MVYSAIYMENLIFFLIILIFSVILHEIAHGYAALVLGDPTAKLAGRLTLNPIKHIDPMGSIIVPGLLILAQSPFIVGAAKPVPYNPYNLSNQRRGEAWVAGAGPLTNVVIALFFGLLARLNTELGLFSSTFTELATVIVFLNIVLAVFNLLPIPPLDGSKVLRQILPYRFTPLFQQFESFMLRNWLFMIPLFLFIFFFFLASIFFAFVLYSTTLATGLEPTTVAHILNTFLTF